VTLSPGECWEGGALARQKKHILGDQDRRGQLLPWVFKYLRKVDFYLSDNGYGINSGSLCTKSEYIMMIALWVAWLRVLFNATRTECCTGRYYMCELANQGGGVCPCINLLCFWTSGRAAADLLAKSQHASDVTLTLWITRSSGIIPSSIGSLFALTNLYLDSNQLSWFQVTCQTSHHDPSQYR
jgi:hypothetical protein